ncbi:TPA: conjugal transfer protein TraL [Citrobacter farmeri]|jgi:hypothetical protein|nr:conjugal transfer protein TraL [Salmonella enterica]EES3185767.1 conjugal transfer protein TraL [Escherichia coli]HCB1657207.1 conjugal transfer protein TraL [Citrobacter farmeri]
MKLGYTAIASAALALFAATGLMAPKTVQAASQDECAIWLCLPGGFPSGCGGAKSAMLKRVKKGKSPLPDFMSCAVKSDSDSTMTYDYNNAAAIQERRVCKRYSGNHNNSRCVEWETIPAHYVKGKTCRINWQTGSRNPEGCTSTYKYVDVFIDGKNAGDTYFWR